jgi:two-component system, chemotaxis family, chemotaxis protein CheY
MCGHRTVVVLDDEPGFGDTVKDALEEEGYAVETAMDGRSGLALLRRLGEQPCLLLLDLVMPVLDGNAVYRELLADPALASIRVVVATSDPTRAPSGVQVLAKPLSLARLIDLVRACCGDGRVSPPA